MKRYRVDIFSNKFEFKDFSVVESNELKIDYITLEKSTVIIPKKISCTPGDYLYIRGDEISYKGIIHEVIFNKTRTSITIKQLLSVLDINVFLGSVFKTQSIEEFIKISLLEYYAGNDTAQNIYGLNVVVKSDSVNHLTYEKNIENLYTIVLDSFSTSDILVECDLDFKNKKFNIVIKKINLTNIKKIETKLSDVINFEVTNNTGAAKFNKIKYINAENESEEVTYCCHTDYSIDTNLMHDRIVPVKSDLKVIKSEKDKSFNQAAQEDAIKELSRSKYDNQIEIIFNSNSKLLEIGEIGQIYRVIDNNVSYYSILTGYQRLNDKHTLLILGTVRSELTQILAIERRSK